MVAVCRNQLKIDYGKIKQKLNDSKFGSCLTKESHLKGGGEAMSKSKKCQGTFCCLYFDIFQERGVELLPHSKLFARFWIFSTEGKAQVQTC